MKKKNRNGTKKPAGKAVQAKGKARQRQALRDQRSLLLGPQNKMASISYAKTASMNEAFRSNEFTSRKDYTHWAQFVSNIKAQGPDLRTNSNNYVWGGLHTPNSNSNSKIVLNANAEVAVGIAASILSHAYLHGYRSNCTDNNVPQYPYFAFAFIYNVVCQVMSGDTDQVPKILFPDFLLEILAAVNPKTGAQIAAGTIGYSWKVNNISTPSSTFLFPATDVYGKYFLANTGTTDNDGFLVMTSISGPYDPIEGKRAFSDLVTFVNGRLSVPTGGYNPYRLRDFAIKGTLMERSVSAFSYVNPVIGSGVLGGAPYSLAALETTVKHPKFACFADPTIKLDRGFRHYRATGGDTTWLVCSLLHQLIAKEVSNPAYCSFKTIDFYEFADRLARVIAQLFEIYYKDTTVQDRITDIGMNYVHYLVLLRKIVMSQFANTQYGVQSLRFYGTSSGDEFYPFLCSSNTSVAVTPTSITLPLFAVENMNSLKGRSTWNEINPKNKNLVKKNPKFYVPVLGVYQKNTFEPKTYTYNNGEGAASIFTSGGNMINLVDGTSSNNEILDLDASPCISVDAEIFNKVMVTLSPYIQCPTLLTGDGGINVLTVIGDTMLVREIVTNTDDLDKKERKERKKKGIDITIFDKKYTAKTSMQYPIQDIDNIKKTFICPETKLQSINSGVGSISTETMRILDGQMYIERYGVQYSASNTGAFVDAATIRRQWVDACVKSKNAEDSLIVQQIRALSEAGRAGILGSLANIFGTVLTPVVASAVDSLIPI